MSTIRFLWILLFAYGVGCCSANAEKRVALVIGNSAYKNVPQLVNPVNDASLLGAMLNQAGFNSVIIKLNLNASDMRKTFREFGAKARDADVAVIYYAGHGIELDGTNYLIPTDAALETDSDVLDETLPLDRAMFAVEPAKKLRLIILDACRDNPFSKTMKRTMAARSVGRGLAKVEPFSPNTMIAFAAKAGSTASDGDNKNSPFAAALVDYLPKPGLDLRKAFGFVRDDVLKNTGFRQEPYVYGSLGGDDVPLVPAKPASATGPQTHPQDAARRDYELALQLGTRDGWAAFLAQYPDGFYSNLAKGQLNKIVIEEARTAAAPSRQPRQAEEQSEKSEESADKTKGVSQTVPGKTAKAEPAQPAAADQPAKDSNAQGEKTPAAADKTLDEHRVATVLPTANPSTVTSTSISPREIAKLVQSELHRVGCLSDAADGEWTSTSRRSLALFNRHAGTRLDIKLASLDTLDTIKSMQGRVCPLTCERGFKVDGDSCVKVNCRSGLQPDDDGTCMPTKSERQAPEKRDTRPPQTAPVAQQGDGSCSRMKDPLGCSCALKTGGYIFPSSRSYSGYRFRWTNDSAYRMCLYAAGRR